MCKHFVAALLLLISISASSQTLFTYGKGKVTVQQFLDAYNKNNTNTIKNSKAIQEYLDLYISSRLKIAEAKSLSYDTLPQLVTDLENLRAQIMPAYMNDEESINKLVNEAFTRSQKDVHLAHIFITFLKDGIYDTINSKKRAIEAFAKLKTGANFSDVAKQYSDDPSVEQNNGDIGFITAFTLPYELENIAYTTVPGKFSILYKSKAGFHILKNLGERKALGRLNAAQILIAYPPDASEDLKLLSKKLADSLYNEIVKGSDFEKLATQFSSDAISAPTGGILQEFGVGEYDQHFENVIFTLKENAVGKPFQTSHGYHIVKIISQIPVNTDRTDKALQALRDKILKSDRMNIAKDALAKKVLKKSGYKKLISNSTELWTYTDSVLDYKKPSTPIRIKPSSALFSIGKEKINVSQWITYSQTSRYKADGSGLKPYTQLWNEFVDAKALEYYQQHLENYNPEFKNQINEFKDGNLFFEIMQRRIWTPAQTDSTALLSYYQKNKSKYYWKQSAEAVIFYTSDTAITAEIINKLKTGVSSWQNISASFNGKLSADSGRFELDQIPNPDKIALRPGVFTAPLINSSDNTSSFAYIISMHLQPEQRSFEEARGLVINDYQNELDNKWVANLKKKYPVSVNQEELSKLIKIQ
jgi:peptidyl-prolyl cis-trans isomerase SurA